MTTPKYADWRARHPEKDTALRAAVASRLGITRTNRSAASDLVIDEWCVAVLGALLNWHAPAGNVPPAVMQALDLEPVPENRP